MGDSEHSDRKSLVTRAGETVRSGGVIIVPTETFYALAADPWQENAVERIFKIKRRQRHKPLPLMAAGRAAVEEATVIQDPMLPRLMDEFWPGSLTLLMEPRRPMSALLTDRNGRIGVRVPPVCEALSVAELAGGWLTATSANLSGDANPDEVGRISSRVLDAVDMVVDAGPTPGGLPSTVAELTRGRLRVIREGAIPAKVLREFLLRQT